MGEQITNLKMEIGTTLMVQWLTPCSQCTGLITGCGTKTSHAEGHSQNKKMEMKKGLDNSQAPTLVNWTRENTLKKYKTGKKSGESVLDNVGIKVEMCSTQLHLTLGRDVNNR